MKLLTRGVCLLLIIRSQLANSNKKLQQISESHFQFSIELYNEVAKSRKDNIVISAHSVNVGLALLFLGTTANSTSSKQLRKSISGVENPQHQGTIMKKVNISDSFAHVLYLRSSHNCIDVKLSRSRRTHYKLFRIGSRMGTKEQLSRFK